MKQPWLPQFDYPDVDEPGPESSAPDVCDEEDASSSATVLPGQGALFTAERQLVGEIEAALANGRFEDARRFRDALLALEGPSANTRDLGMLDEVGAAGFWDRPLPLVLNDWLALHDQLVELPHLRWAICDGGLSRILEAHAPAEIVRTAPTMLAAVTNHLCLAAAADGEIPDEAARLVRDALLEGLDPVPGDFADARFVDLLAEDHRPVWLACLGALRHLWPVPSVDPSELAKPMDADAEDEDERGHQFWACLRRTVSCARDDPAAVAARMRMKRLHSDMHARFMRQGVERE